MWTGDDPAQDKFSASLIWLSGLMYVLANTLDLWHCVLRVHSEGRYLYLKCIIKMPCINENCEAACGHTAQSHYQSPDLPRSPKETAFVLISLMWFILFLVVDLWPSIPNADTGCWYNEQFLWPIFKKKGIPRHFGKRKYWLSSQKLDEKIDTSLIPAWLIWIYSYSSLV